MIVCRLKGGLGNQLFQYALARSLSEKFNQQFKLDISSYKEDFFQRTYMLGKFNIIENIASKEDLKHLHVSTSKSLVGRLSRKANKLLPGRMRYIIEEVYPYIFDENILQYRRNFYLNGYWQNEKYFCDIRSNLLCELVVKSTLQGTNKELASNINKENSVGVHIRRHKGIINKPELYEKTIKQYGLITKDYYLDAINLISKRQGKLEIIVFSDDIEWAKRNLSTKYPTIFVDNNDESKGYEDFRLLSMCKHQIIANSTFSWWAAWLNNNPERIVVAPQQWVKDLPHIPSGLFPKNWNLI